MANQEKKVGKREFIQHTSKYLKWVEENNSDLVITHLNHPALILAKIKMNTISDLSNKYEVEVKEDINEHVLPGYDEWSS